MLKSLKSLVGRISGGRYTLVRTMTLLGRKFKVDVFRDEYIRIATLELFAEEIRRRSLPGSVAEVGVFQGDFAKYINRLFPERNLYLFDTFEGFDAGQIKDELKRGEAKTGDDFSKTSVETVLAKMAHPDKVVVRKGLFPQTAEGLESELFCLVSLDCDLHDPLRAGLDFFYPRMVPGGAIFVHDFNNHLYEGARRAVEEFGAENALAIVPIPDSAGTVVIVKPATIQAVPGTTV